MAKLDSIQISGIRSFGIEKHDTQQLKFFSPLTLFLGQNGCGKTTVIEAIKYATTGELPGGTSSGQGFVSDPYMHHQPSVTGQIKLAITDVRGNKAVIVRSLKCEKSGAAGNLKFQTLDSTLQHVAKNGERKDETHRNADLNALTINLMGVPQAILSNVIFCHQEQSLWPLDEGSKVKQKFDAIFDSTKFNACVDSMRKLIKSKEDGFKLLVQEVKYTKEKKDEVQTKRLRLQDRENKMNNIDGDIENLGYRKLPIDNRLKEIYEVEKVLLDLIQKLAYKENDKKNLVSLQNELRSQIKKEFAGSDAELQTAINEFNNKKNKQDQDIQDLINDKSDFERKEIVLKKKVERNNLMVAQKSEEIKSYHNKINERNQYINDLSTSLNQDTFTLNTENDASHAVNTINESVQLKRSNLDKQKDEYRQEEKQLQIQVDELRKKLTEVEQERNFKLKEIGELQKEQRQIKGKIKELDVSDVKLQQYDKRIAELDRDLNNLTGSFNEAQVTKEIEDHKKQIKRLEEKLEELEGENKIWQRNSITENELEILRNNIRTHENDIDQMKNQQYDEFNILFNDSFPESSLKNAVDKLRYDNSFILNDLYSKCSITQKNVTRLESDLKYGRKEVETKERELTQSKTRISKLCGSTEYNEKCNELQSSIQFLQKSKGEQSVAKILYEKYINDFKVKKCCPVCTTNFSVQQKAINDIIKTLENKIKNIPAELNEVEKELTQQDGLYKQLLQLKPVNDKIKEFTNLIPTLNEKLQKQTEEYEATKGALTEYENAKKQPQLIVDTCSKVVSTAAIIDQNGNDIKRWQARIASLETQLIPINSLRSKQRTEVEIENTKLDISSLRDTCDRNHKKMVNMNKQLQNLREQKNDVVQKQLELKKLMQDKPQLLDRLKAAEEKESTLTNNVESLSEEQLIINTDLLSAIDIMDMTKNTHENEIRNNETAYFNYIEALNNIKKIHNQVAKVNGTTLTGQLAELQAENTELKTQLDALLKSREDVIEKINNLRIEKSNQESRLRYLKDNESLRDKISKESVVDTEITELKNKIGRNNHKSIMSEKDRLNRDKAAIDREVQNLEGKKEELQATINEVRAELEKPNNKNIDVDYRNLIIKSKVTELAIANLRTYSEVLEKAICAFHQTRMTQINRNLRQLWTQIYKGNDIEYIQIETDVVHRASKRSYKYRVMQKKNDTTLEMRGRCSAGQKVLACLIIRIALAETFSGNCGILALDEPTTNLDRENINSLSEALANIINTRRAHKNFQLLVITHDEEFLRTLRSVECLRYYYRLQRNNKGCTNITTELL